MSKIAIDMMGTDLGIKPIIDALKVFMKKYDDVTFILIGVEKELKDATAAAKLDNTKYEIFATTEVIAITEGMMEVRRKPNSSMVRGTELLRDQKVDALVSGGSTAAFLASCHFIVGEISGVSRPAFMPFIPTVNKGKSVLMLDVGANLENDAQDLVNFAIMASVYAQEIMHNPKPSVAILNIGEEASKGKDYHKEAYKLLENNKNIFFKGNIEPRDITSDVVDIIVTDGFTGNIALKTLEGIAKNLMGVIKHELTKNFYRKLKSFSLRKSFRVVRKTFDYRNNAAALVLGLRAIAVKTHGISDEKSWISTLKLTRTAVVNDFVQKMTVKLLKGD